MNNEITYQDIINNNYNNDLYNKYEIEDENIEIINNYEDDNKDYVDKSIAQLATENNNANNNNKNNDSMSMNANDTLAEEVFHNEDINNETEDQNVEENDNNIEQENHITRSGRKIKQLENYKADFSNKKYSNLVVSDNNNILHKDVVINLIQCLSLK